MMGRRLYNLLEKLLSGYTKRFADLPSRAANDVPVTDAIEARMLALGPAALVALLVIRMHDVVMLEICFANATAFAGSLPDILRLFDDGSAAPG